MATEIAPGGATGPARRRVGSLRLFPKYLLSHGAVVLLTALVCPRFDTLDWFEGAAPLFRRPPGFAGPGAGPGEILEPVGAAGPGRGARRLYRVRLERA